MAWILDAVGCSFSCREGSAGPPLKNVMPVPSTSRVQAEANQSSVHYMHKTVTREAPHKNRDSPINKARCKMGGTSFGPPKNGCLILTFYKQWDTP
jgi:hypothetical protein